ncbi:hypothetical protein C1H46_019453 [Malus baccata]|uniref:Transmembrane protein 18 n=1 Tax=Malus baccata TaxID=106549 RepID=A0A540M828_MALBA|nr:hypothetical protein C1H46_019453 [Malus baccata]
MEQVRSAMEEHMDQMADLVQKLSAELRSGLAPAVNNFLGFFHAIDWTEPWLMGLMGMHLVLLIVAITSRRNLNFQMFLFLLAFVRQDSIGALTKLYIKLGKEYQRFVHEFLGLDWTQLFSEGVAGVYLAERLNTFLRANWKSFAGQDYFDEGGVFLSTLWSGPLLIIAIIILVNTLFSLCRLIVKWKRAELRHRARLSQSKQD